MAPRPPSWPRRPVLGLLPAMLLPLGCAAEGVETTALREALDSSRASLVAIAPPLPEAAAAAPPAASRSSPPSPVALALAPATGQAPPQAVAQMLGARPSELRHWLGEPQLRRAEGPAEVWLYAAGGCALDVILYRKGHGGLYVAHAAARASGPEPRTEAACLREIATPAAAPPGATAARAGA